MEKKTFDLNNFRNYKNMENNLKSGIEESEKTIETYQKIIDVNKKLLEQQKTWCNHDLLLHVGKENTIDGETGLTFCLTCGTKMFISEEAKTNENVIDVEGIINPEYLHAYDNDVNILVARARKKLLSLSFTNPLMDLDELKANILEDLVYYTDELEYRKVTPRKRVKSISGRK